MTDDAEHSDDARWLAEAVALAVANVEAGGGPFGALIVRDGAVLATGVNAVATTNDPTAHAEVVAVRAACRAIGDFRLNGCVLVTSCEQWPMAVTSTPLADPAAPFTAWRAKPDRVDY